MTQEEFQRLVTKCQPHKVFNSDWSHFYSRDFADTLLPKVELTKGKAIEFYDGADLLPNDNSFPRHFLQLTPDSKLINLTLFSYPKGVKAEQKRSTVQPEKFELCIFFEIEINERISIFLNSGDNFKTILRSISKTKEVADVSSNINDKIFSTTLSAFQSFFKDEYSHYKVLAYVGKLIGIDLEEIHNNTVLKVHINSIKAYTSEPADNAKRKQKEKLKKYIAIDFEIINQPATIYSIFVFKNGKEFYKLGYLPDVTVSNHPEKVEPDPKKGFHQPGKYQIEWDCTDNGIFDTKDVAEKFTIKIQATNEYKETAISQADIVIKDLVDKAEVNNFIIVLKPQSNNKPDIEVRVYGNEIIDRQRIFSSKIPAATIEKLTDEQKLILNLSIIMTKLGLIHGALCQIHWLEGSKESLKFPYDFFMSEERVKDIDRKNLESLFEEVEYLSIENLGYQPSNPDAKQLFLYNDSIGAIKRALALFNSNLSKRTESGWVGDYKDIAIHINEKPITKENLFQSFSIGSALGNIDDVGTSLGRYSQRCYFRAIVSKNENINKWELNIEEVASRFADEFSFNDDLFDIGPIEYSQPLGCWHTNTDSPKLPHYSKIHTPDGTTVCLQNGDYISLKEKLIGNEKKRIPPIIANCCNDFLIYSELKIISDEFIKKTITIF